MLSDSVESAAKRRARSSDLKTLRRHDFGATCVHKKVSFPIIAIRAGTPRPDRLRHRGHSAPTSFGRTLVAGRVRVLRDGIEGDEVGDPSVHGGAERALLVYAQSNYGFWSKELGLSYADAVARGFGENVTLESVDERDICVGDLLEVGDVILEVSQPRSPCWKIGAYWGVSTLTKDVYRSGRTGWFCRVKREGSFDLSQRVALSARPHPDLTIQALNDAVVEIKTGPIDPRVHAALCEKAAGCTALAPGWRQAFARFGNAGTSVSSSQPGPAMTGMTVSPP